MLIMEIQHWAHQPTGTLDGNGKQASGQHGKDILTRYEDALQSQLSPPAPAVKTLHASISTSLNRNVAYYLLS